MIHGLFCTAHWYLLNRSNSFLGEACLDSSPAGSLNQTVSHFKKRWDKLISSTVYSLGDDTFRSNNIENPTPALKHGLSSSKLHEWDDPAKVWRTRSPFKLKLGFISPNTYTILVKLPLIHIEHEIYWRLRIGYGLKVLQIFSYCVCQLLT